MGSLFLISCRAILHKGMRTIYNTHMHKRAFDVEEMNEEQQKAEHTEGKVDLYDRDAVICR